MTTWKIVKNPQGGHTLIRTDDSNSEHPVTSMPLSDAEEVLELQDTLEQHTYAVAWESGCGRNVKVAKGIQKTLTLVPPSKEDL